ncbi:hypothetical protein C6P45_001262 [Maudiozyma exigua]|uniref:C2H2-type domain-containing protein n=1 Tax=Maudiozyma exigua TaxID=34358 RepID=A0A9P6W188_MAUEX|nr:hypothetical protein C6P45_001262 [Kazachstania exigua]
MGNTPNGDPPVEADLKSQLSHFNDWPLPSSLKDEKLPIKTSRSVSTTSSRAKTHFCDYSDCDKAFSRPSLLTEHQQAVHLGLKPFECNQCDKTYSRKTHLERHLLSHLDNEMKPFHCSICNKGVITQQQLKRHEITHTKSFACPYKECNEAFYKHPQLRSHIMSFHLQKLTCHQCQKTFQRPYRLENHMKKHHNPDVSTPYNCKFPGCLKSFKTWTQLTLHTKNDHPKLECKVCKKHLVGENGLKMHMRIHDDTLVTRNWKCQICTPVLSFPRKQTLLQHYTDMHPNEPLPVSLETHQTATTNVQESSEEQILSSKKRKRIPNVIDDIKNEARIGKYLKPSITAVPNTNRSAMELLLNTVGRKLRCPHDKCYRTFKTKERYELHIEKHKIHEEKLKKLELEKEDPLTNPSEQTSIILPQAESLSVQPTHNLQQQH